MNPLNFGFFFFMSSCQRGQGYINFHLKGVLGDSSFLTCEHDRVCVQQSAKRKKLVFFGGFFWPWSTITRLFCFVLCYVMFCCVLRLTSPWLTQHLFFGCFRCFRIGACKNSSLLSDAISSRLALESCSLTSVRNSKSKVGQVTVNDTNAGTNVFNKASSVCLVLGLFSFVVQGEKSFGFLLDISTD